MKYRAANRGAVNPLFQLVVFVIAIAILGVLVYRQFLRIGAFTRPVVVAATPLTEGTVLESEQLQTIRMRKRATPPDALGAAADAEGRTLTRAKQPGEPITVDDLRYAAVTRAERLASLIPDGRVMTTLTLDNLTIPPPELQRGDRIDIVASPVEDPSRARIVVRNAYVVGFVVTGSSQRQGSADSILGVDLSPPELESTGEETALLLALQPTDVMPLAELDGSGAHINLVLHSTETVRSGRMLHIEGNPSSKSIELIAGTERRRVSVQ